MAIVGCYFIQVIVNINDYNSLSDELRFWRNAFEKHYKDRYRTRKLTWFNNLGFVDVRAYYRDRKKEFIVSTL